MKKFFNKIQKNKGFTLVELIVVIAVLGVITVISIPQFTGYIEKSRRGTDRNAVKEVAHAVQVAYVDNRKEDPKDNEVTLSIGDDGSVSYTSLGGGLDGVVAEILTTDAYVYKSELYRGNDVTYIVDEVTGEVTISTTDVIDEKMADVEEERQAVADAQNEVDKELADVTQKQQELAQTQAELEDAKKSFKEAEDECVKKQKEYENASGWQATAAYYAWRAADVAMDAAQIVVEEVQKDVDQQQKDLDAEEKELADAKENLKQAQANLDEKEKDLADQRKFAETLQGDIELYD